MTSFRTLFLGVYASSGFIRMLFLPLSYVVLLTPFLVLGIYFFGTGQILKNYVREDFSWIDLLPQIALLTVFVLLPTRLLSGSGTASVSKDGGKRRVQSLPYWIPGLQNLGSLVTGGEAWLKSVGNPSINSIITYSAAGSKHNVIFSEKLLDHVSKNMNNLKESSSSRWAVIRNAYGLPKRAKDQYFELETTFAKAFETELFQSKNMATLLPASLAILSESLPDFITFNSSIVDQMQWERVSDVELTDGTEEAECNMLTLVNEFCCNTILPPIMGAQFTESYQLLATDLAAFNQRYWALATGLTRLAPIQGLPGAALAQKRLLQNLRNLFRDITNPPSKRVPADDESVSGDETDADVDTPIMRINELFTEHDLPLPVRATIALELMHSLVAEIVPLVFWTLIQIYSASAQDSSNETTPLQKVKEETKLWAQAIQPPSIHPSFPAPPEISFGSASEATSPKSFSYLRSCICEARRIYTIPASIYEVTKPVTLSEPGVRQDVDDQWELEPNSYIDVGLSRTIINSSTTQYPEPKTFRPDRFLTSTPSSIIDPLDVSEPYKSALLVSLISGIIQLWEIRPAPKKTFFDHMQEARQEARVSAAALGGNEKAAKSSAVLQKEEQEKKAGKWVLPKAVDGASVKVPRGDVRIRVRRREGLPAKKMGAKR